MHLFDASLGFLGGHGIVGGHIPLSSGHGVRHQVPEHDQVAVCYFGEAAVNNGAFHEALNMAALWKLPCDLHLREQPLRHGHRARAGQRHLRHFGARVLVRHGRTRSWTARTCSRCMRRWSAPCSARARTSSRPCSRSAPIASWATRCPTRSTDTIGRKEEVEEHRKRDPDRGLVAATDRRRDSWTRRRSQAMDAEVIAEVEDAYQFADEAPDPDAETLYTDVYA